MYTLAGICLIISLASPSFSRPPSNLDYRYSLQVLPVKTCADLIAAGHDVVVNTPDGGDINYAMCVVKVPRTQPISASRRSFDRPGVEVGPGEFKSEIINYSPNFLESKLKFLLEMKKKQEDELKEGRR